jgi:hypothetical protein
MLSLLKFEYVSTKFHGLTARNKSRQVVYDPYATTELFNSIFLQVSATAYHFFAHVLISVAEESEFAVLTITNPHYPWDLLPIPNWDQFTRDIEGEKHYESLREIGGFVEPLIWDKGYGRGVILRLPWANRSS